MGCFNAESEELANLAEKYAQGDAVEETDQNRLGQEVRQRAELKKTRANAEEPGQKGECQRQREIQRFIAKGEWCNRCGDQCAGGRIRADDQLARAAKNRVGQERQDTRVKAGNRAEASQLCVGYANRQRDGSHRQASQQIVAEIAPLIVEQRR